MDQYLSNELASKANKWSGRNCSRWRSDEYDKTYKLVETELDPVKRAVHLSKLNDLVSSDGYIIPIVSRPRVSGVAMKVVAQLSGWDNINWALGSWYRDV
jgi:peptide/nickel transport system substrate-binding protein